MPYATNAGVRIHYESEGNGSGLPLVGHSGVMTTIGIWYESGYVDALKADYRLILLDPRGHGDSDKPHDADAYGPAPTVADVLAVLDAVGLERAHYLGYSWGGRVGFDLGVQAPHRVLSLTLGGMHPFARDSQQEVQQFTQRAALLRQEGMAGFIAAAERTTEPMPPERRARWLAQDGQAVAAYYEAQRVVPSLEAELPAVQVPTLVFCGEKDPAHAGAERAAALMPQATFLSLPGLDHLGAGMCTDLVIPHMHTLHARVASTAANGA